MGCQRENNLAVCPRCGSGEIVGDLFEGFECLDCGLKFKPKVETPQEWLKRHKIPEERWPKKFRPK